jgi:threonine/homoserine/homoserine lactone efflux protein
VNPAEEPHSRTLAPSAPGECGQNPDMLTLFWQGFALGFPAAVLPGSLQAYYLAQTLAHGWRRTLPAAFAPLFSDGPIIALVLLLLAQLPPAGLALVQLTGGCFLLWLAWQAWGILGRSAPTISLAETDAPAPVSIRSLIGQAALINLLNPNPYLFWSTVGGVWLLNAWRTSPGHALAFMLGMYLTLCGGFALLILLFGALGAIPDSSGRIGRSLTLFSISALLAFGLWQISRAVPVLWDIVG